VHKVLLYCEDKIRRHIGKATHMDNFAGDGNVVNN
jgi:hypothetical protein